MAKNMEIRLRCFAQRQQNGVCEAFCIDLNLAAQGDSLEEVRRKLEAMIASYVQFVCTEYPQDAGRLLRRPSPWQIRLRYRFVRLALMFRSAKERATQWLTPAPAQMAHCER